MLLSHKKRFIFIHIYKTAGMTVMNEFLLYARLRDRLVHEYKTSRLICSVVTFILGWQNGGYKQFAGHHMHAKASELYEEMRESFENYFKFTFVRNPFDHLVSLYFYVGQVKRHPLHDQAKNNNFSEFIKWYIDTNPEKQIDFLLSQDRKTNLVDFIGRYECLNQHLNQVKAGLGMEQSEDVARRNVSVSRKAKDYRECYSQTSVDLVQDYFRDDLDILGYCFDGPVNMNPVEVCLDRLNQP